jgi:hypothetical protein
VRNFQTTPLHIFSLPPSSSHRCICILASVHAPVLLKSGHFPRAPVAQSVWRLATGWKTAVRVRFPVGSSTFDFSISSGPVPGPTQPLIQWVQGAVSWGQDGRHVKPNTHLQLVPGSRERGSLQLFPQTSSWRSA